MISKELKKLNRRELVDVIYQLKKNEEQMQEQIAQLETELQDKRIHISVAGSIAEAAMDITGLFASAQTTADLYLQEITCMKEETARQCEKLLEEAKQEAESIMADGKKKYDALMIRYKADYQKWQKLHAQLEQSGQLRRDD